MRGRKPIPTQLNRLRGNPGRRPLNDQEPVAPALDAVPEPPRYLSVRAKAEWRRVAKEMLPLGLLVALDRTMLAAYCAAAGQFAEASHQLKTQDLSTKPGTKWLFIQSMAMKAMKQFAPELGISLSARSRIKVSKPEKKNPFELYLAKGRETK